IGVPPLPLRQPGAESRLAEGAAFRLGWRARAVLARAPAFLSSAGTRLRQGRYRAVFDDFGRGPIMRGRLLKKAACSASRTSVAKPRRRWFRKTRAVGMICQAEKTTSAKPTSLRCRRGRRGASRYWGGLYKFIDWAIPEKHYLGPRPTFECIDPENL